MPRMSSILTEYGEIFTAINKKEVLCTICSQKLGFRGKYSLKQHVKGKKHVQNERGISHKKFVNDLCEAFLGANIPLNKLKNSGLRSFLRKYTKQEIPHHSTIRNYYVPQQFDKTINKISSKLGENYVWISADETTDIKGRCVVNVIVGTLHPENPPLSFLVATKIRVSITAEEICDIIINSLKNVISDDCLKVLLFLSDSASVMLKTGKLLKEHFPNMLYLTCVVHGIHRIAELIREEFPDVNSLINSFKKILLKAPSRRALYKEMCVNIPLPPEPIVTRWGTWLEAAFFYAQHFLVLKPFVLKLKQDAASIKECQKLIVNEDLPKKLEFISKNFSDIPATIKFLESKNLTLTESLQKLESLFNSLKTIEGSIGAKIQNKFNSVMQRNPDYVVLKQISSNTLNTQNENLYLRYKNLIPHFRFAPVTTCDVERSFSKFKNILTSQRTQFTTSNLEKYVLINSYYTYITRSLTMRIIKG